MITHIEYEGIVTPSRSRIALLYLAVLCMAVLTPVAPVLLWAIVLPLCFAFSLAVVVSRTMDAAQEPTQPDFRSLRTLMLCCPLILGSLMGIQMKPEEIKLMSQANQAKIAYVLPAERLAACGGLPTRPERGQATRAQHVLVDLNAVGLHSPGEEGLRILPVAA
jgi:hypothetical protein